MSKSHDLFQQAQQHIPGGVNSPVRAFHGVGGEPVFFNKSKGAYLFDEDGQRYIDVVTRKYSKKEVSYWPKFFGRPSCLLLDLTVRIQHQILQPP